MAGRRGIRGVACGSKAGTTGWAISLSSSDRGKIEPSVECVAKWLRTDCYTGQSHGSRTQLHIGVGVDVGVGDWQEL
jgi:hypothetical protein